MTRRFYTEQDGTTVALRVHRSGEVSIDVYGQIEGIGAATSSMGSVLGFVDFHFDDETRTIPVAVRRPSEIPARIFGWLAEAGLDPV